MCFSRATLPVVKRLRNYSRLRVAPPFFCLCSWHVRPSLRINDDERVAAFTSHGYISLLHQLSSSPLPSLENTKYQATDIRK